MCTTSELVGGRFVAKRRRRGSGGTRSSTSRSELSSGTAGGRAESAVRWELAGALRALGGCLALMRRSGMGEGGGGRAEKAVTLLGQTERAMAIGADMTVTLLEQAERATANGADMTVALLQQVERA